MNQSLFVDLFDSKTANHEDYAPDKMRTEHQRMTRTAGKRSKNAFSNSISEDTKSFEEQHEVNQAASVASVENGPQFKADPGKELSYLFKTLDEQWHTEARRYYYLIRKGCEPHVYLPICIEKEHKSVFHFLFSALPFTGIKSLTLSQAILYLNPSDLVCLGQAIRRSKSLTTLNLQSLDKVLTILKFYS